jgi:hypothetical protein
MKRTFPLISLLLISSFLLGACGSSKDNESIIATSVALTVQAQQPSITPEVSFPSVTPPADPGSDSTLTPVITPTATNIPGFGSYGNCTLASLVSENPPDKTIYKPGQKFLKTWHIQNNSTCTWNTSYKLIFWNGSQMGGAYNYNFPQTLPPGESADVTIELAAPDTVGTYKGEWQLQTPDGHNFGVGQYSAPFWTEIEVVSADATPGYGVSDVTYNLERDPVIGCVTNVWFYLTATVSFSGPMKEVILQFQHSDGNRSGKFKLEITEAGTQTIKNEWSFHLGASTGPKWIRLTQVFPQYVEYDKVNFTYDCK